MAVLWRYGQANDCPIVPAAWLVGLVRLRPSRRPCPGAPFTASRDQLGAISRSLAPVRQSPDKLTSDIAKLQAAKPDTPGPDISVSRTSAPPPAAVVTGRKVVTPASHRRGDRPTVSFLSLKADSIKVGGGSEGR
jgi:hypothetical protein